MAGSHFIDFKLDQIRQTVSLLIQALGLEKKLFFKGGKVQNKGKGVYQGLIVKMRLHKHVDLLADLYQKPVLL